VRIEEANAPKALDTFRASLQDSEGRRQRQDIAKELALTIAHLNAAMDSIGEVIE
jgi:hypothetical protein